MKKQFLPWIFPAVLLSVLMGITIAQDAKDKKDKATKDTKTIKALMVTGEGYHDYESQKKILSEGTAERLDIDWTIWHHKSPEAYKKALVGDWAKEYDIVLYNICHAKEADSEFIDSVAAVHEAGKPCIALHCSMHSFHWRVKGEPTEKTWNKLLGVSSKGHGPKAAISVTKVEEHKDHPVLKGIPDDWKTPEGELYNVQHVLDGTTVLAHGENGVAKEPQAVVWVNEYGKGRVMSTTIGHHNSTMESKEYLDLVANGIQWAVGEEAK